MTSTERLQLNKLTKFALFHYLKNNNYIVANLILTKGNLALVKTTGNRVFSLHFNPYDETFKETTNLEDLYTIIKNDISTTNPSNLNEEYTKFLKKQEF
jgi:hypothetical protein